MTTITLNIPSDKIDKILTAICANHGYSETINDPETNEPIANPVSKAQFAKNWLIEDIKSEVKTYQDRVALQEVIDEDLAIS